MEAERSVSISKKQVLLEFTIDGDVFKIPFWVTPRPIVPVILGADFLRKTELQ
jgi:hypothetical protein